MDAGREFPVALSGDRLTGQLDSALDATTASDTRAIDATSPPSKCPSDGITHVEMRSSAEDTALENSRAESGGAAHPSVVNLPSTNTDSLQHLSVPRNVKDAWAECPASSTANEQPIDSGKHKRRRLGWGKGLGGKKSAASHDELLSNSGLRSASGSLGIEWSADGSIHGPWEQLGLPAMGEVRKGREWYESRIADVTTRESSLESKRQLEAREVKQREEQLQAIACQLEELQRPVHLVMPDPEEPLTSDSESDAEAPGVAALESPAAPLQPSAHEAAAVKGGGRPASAEVPCSSDGRAAPMDRGSPAPLPEVQRRGHDTPRKPAEPPPPPPDLPPPPRTVSSHPSRARHSPDDPFIAAVLGSGALRAAQAHAAAWQAAPAALQCRWHAVQRIAHMGHIMLRMRPLIRSPWDAPSVAAAASAHQELRERLLRLVIDRAARLDALYARLAEEYVLKYEAYMRTQPFATKMLGSRRASGIGACARSQHAQDLQLQQVQAMANLDITMPRQHCALEAHTALFRDTSGRIHQPVQHAQLERCRLPWSPDEKARILAAYLEHRKDFYRVAAAVRTRSVTDCIQWFSLNRNTSEFNKIMVKYRSKKRRHQRDRDAGRGIAPPPPPLPKDAAARKGRTVWAGKPAKGPGSASGAARSGSGSMERWAGEGAGLRQPSDGDIQAAARSCGKDFAAIGARLGCAASAAQALWKRHNKRLELDRLAAQHTAAFGDGGVASQRSSLAGDSSAALDSSGALRRPSGSGNGHFLPANGEVQGHANWHPPSQAHLAASGGLHSALMGLFQHGSHGQGTLGALSGVSAPPPTLHPELAACPGSTGLVSSAALLGATGSGQGGTTGMDATGIAAAAAAALRLPSANGGAGAFDAAASHAMVSEGLQHVLSRLPPAEAAQQHSMQRSVAFANAASSAALPAGLLPSFTSVDATRLSLLQQLGICQGMSLSAALPQLSPPPLPIPPASASALAPHVRPPESQQAAARAKPATSWVPEAASTAQQDLQGSAQHPPAVGGAGPVQILNGERDAAPDGPPPE